MVFSVASPLPNRPLFRFGLWPSGPPWVRDCSHLSTSSNRKRITRFLLPALRTICGRSPAAHILEIVAWLSCNRSPSCFCVSKFISSCCLRARPTHPEGLASIVCEVRPLAAAVPTGLMPEHLFEKRLGFSPVRVRHWHLVGSPDLRLVVFRPPDFEFHKMNSQPSSDSRSRVSVFSFLFPLVPCLFPNFREREFS